MELLSEFHFLRPLWLLAILPALGLVYLLARRDTDRTRWQQAVDAELLPHLLEGMGERGRRLSFAALLGTWIIATLALAGPVWERLPQPVEKRSDALVVVLDLSLSMYAEDLTPSRLVRARHKIADVLAMRREGFTALVVYAGDAHAVTPLTDDTKTITNLLSALSPSMMPELGSNVKDALALARDLLKRADHEQGRTLLITDEVADWRDVADGASREFPVAILGVGTEEGAPIPLDFAERPGHLKDDDGVIVIPRLDPGALRRAATEGYGRYATITITDDDLEYLLATPLSAFEDATIAVDRDFDIWADQGHWLALLVLPAALWAFRRGVLAVGLVLLLAGAPSAHAGFWDDLWLRRDQQAQAALEEGDPERAAGLFERDDWRGTAFYRDGQYGRAAETFSRLDDVESEYNLGNALAKAGELQSAIGAYGKVLEREPEHEDAAFNKALLESLLQQGNQSQDQSGSPDDSQASQSQSEEGTPSSGGQQDPQQRDRSRPEEQNAQNQEQEEQEHQQNEGQDPRDEQRAEQRRRQLELADAEKEERRQALEQWLERVPDDPGGLLRRKFRHETQQRYREGRTRRNREKIW